MTDSALSPAMPVAESPDWRDACWIGAIDDQDPRLADVAIELADGKAFGSARLLVRHGLAPRGTIDVPVSDAKVSGEQVRAAIMRLPDARPSPMAADAELPPVTVALCTRDRLTYVQSVVPRLLDLDHPCFEVLVVDNAPTDDSVRRFVESLADPRVRVVTEYRPGLSCARNRALSDARYGIVAFTDDDVITDRDWLRALTAAFVAEPDAAVVTGSVRTGELRTETQAYFERRIHWEGSLTRRVFRIATPPPDVPIFPFELGHFGTGANFAIRREVAVALGGFDEALGAGTRTGGGEDIDIFVRALYGGGALVSEPSALAWHKHRDDDGALRAQMRTYGRGLSAWMVAVLANPESRGDALRAVGRAARRLNRVARADRAADPSFGPDNRDRMLRATEIKGLLVGPFTYAGSRLSGRSSRPLLHR